MCVGLIIKCKESSNCLKFEAIHVLLNVLNYYKVCEIRKYDITIFNCKKMKSKLKPN